MLSGHNTEILRRIGYGAKGILYGVLGMLAVTSAFGAGSQNLGFKDAIQWVTEQPFGAVILGILILGLVSYSLYRLGTAIFDLENNGSDKKAIAKRIGYLCSGLAYAALAVFASSQLFAGQSSSGGTTKNQLVGMLLDNTAGMIFLGVVAGGLILAGLNQLYRGWTGKYRDRFAMSELPSGTSRFVKWSARLGLTSRAIIFGLMGYLLVLAVLQSNPNQAGGTEKALSWLSGTTASSWLFALVAAGLVAYAIYAAAIAYCGKFRTA